MQPITKLGTINVLQGLKRPQKSVVRLIKDVDWVIYAECLWTKIIFIVLKSTQILIENMLSNIEWIWPI